MIKHIQAETTRLELRIALLEQQYGIPSPTAADRLNDPRLSEPEGVINVAPKASDDEEDSYSARISSSSFERLRDKGSWNKFGRGALNTVTGWVEVPKQVHRKTTTGGVAKGLTMGLLQGLTQGFVRTVGGVYEVVTFPMPSGPIMDPDYLWNAPRTKENY